MLTIANLFGKSPFAPLQSHMNKVADCIDQLPQLFSALAEKDNEKIQRISDHICRLEHEADLTKNDIRNHLPRSLFLPIDRGNLLEILSLQDCLADKAEDIGVILTMRPLEHYGDFKEDFELFCTGNIEAFKLARLVVKELDCLLESSFGGIEAEKVKAMVEKIAFKEHELDRMQYRIVKKLYSLGEKIPYHVFFMWLTLIKEIGALSNLSEKLGNRIRMILELK